MNLEEFRTFCLAKKGVTEEFPFDEYALTFKVMGKVFSITSLNGEQFKVNLKCNPERAIELRDEFEEVQPGYHMNKKHWNTENFEGNLSDKLLIELTNHSYELVVKGLTKKQKEELNSL